MRSAPRRVFGYCRVSSVEQARGGTSLDGQQEEIARWCRAHGYQEPSLRIEVESGSAEKAEKREEQLRVIREAEPDDLIVVVAVDRWSRDVVHAIGTVRALVKRGVRWYAIREALDAATPQGDSTLTIMAWVADQERSRIRDRTVGRRKELADAGHFVAGSVPLGYRRVAARKIEVVPEEAEVVLKAFRLSAEGHSLSDIASRLPPIRKRRTWNLHAVHQVLHCRYVLGEQRLGDGSWKPDAHPAIVTYDLWERAHAAARQRVHGGRKYAEGFSARCLLRGVARCATCGRKVSVKFGAPRATMDPNDRFMSYYICRGRLARECEEGWSPAVILDAKAEQLIVARLVELRDEIARPPVASPAKPKVVDVKAALAKIEAARARIISAFADSEYTREDMKRALAEQDERAQRLRREDERFRARREAEERAADPVRRAGMLRHVSAIKAAWEAMTVGERREVLDLLAKGAKIGGREVVFEWRTVAELLAKEEM